MTRCRLMTGFLKVIPRAEFEAVVVWFFAEFRLPAAADPSEPETQLQVGDPCVEEFRRDAVAAVVQVDHCRQGRGEIEDVQGFLLAQSQVEVVLHRVVAAIAASLLHVSGHLAVRYLPAPPDMLTVRFGQVRYFIPAKTGQW